MWHAALSSPVTQGLKRHILGAFLFDPCKIRVESVVTSSRVFAVGFLVRDTRVEVNMFKDIGEFEKLLFMTQRGFNTFAGSFTPFLIKPSVHILCIKTQK